MLRLSAAALACFLIAGSIATSASAQSPPAPTAAMGEECPAHVRVYALNGQPNKLVFGVWGDDGGATASGSIIAYVNGGRYELPFTDAVMPDERDATAVPTPIVVAFDGPATFESAYLGSIEGTPCAIHSPFFRKPLTRSGLEDVAAVSLYPARDWNSYLAKAAALPPLHAPAPQPADKPACKNLYAEPTVSDLQIPQPPTHSTEYFGGSIIVRVALDQNGKPKALRLDRPEKDRTYDTSALFAATQSKYTPEIFRCAPVSASYYFDANFNAVRAIDATIDADPMYDRGKHNGGPTSHNK